MFYSAAAAEVPFCVLIYIGSTIFRLNSNIDTLPKYFVHVESYTVEVEQISLMKNEIVTCAFQGTNFSSRHAQYYIMCACADESRLGWIVNHR